jgi:TrmH family RNA methyltransferase
MSIRIVLVGTTHPGNIGAVARAMKNMGLTDLALVNPKIFPHAKATARASGAVDVLKNATVVESLAEALKDCVYVAGASARSRSLAWPTMEPRECAAKFTTLHEQGVVAAVFGPEKSGLSNSDLDYCDTLLTIPTNPDFSSLNLAMSVQVFTYELRMAMVGSTPAHYADETPLATSEEMEHFYGHLEKVLTEVDFLDPDNPRHLMRRLRRMFVRTQVDKNEVNILRGILTAFEKHNGGKQ